jgi:uncharacterized protein YndB with AHSA1/START domain
MADHVSVTTEIAAPPEQVWDLVSDLTRMHEWSPENDAVTWRNGATGAVPGATFKGTNRSGKKEWATTGTVVEAVPGRVLSFRVKAVGMKVALWTYRFEPTDGGCAVTESWDDERGALVTFLGKPVSGVADRATHNRAGMEETLRKLKAAAEGA